MTKQLWTIEAQTDHYASLGSVDGEHMQTVLDWAVANDRFVESEAKAPLFSIAGKSSERLFAVFSSGHVYVWFEEHRYPGGVDERDALGADLVSLGLMKAGFEASAVKEGKNMSRKVGDLDDGAMGGLIELLGRYCL